MIYYNRTITQSSIPSWSVSNIGLQVILLLNSQKYHSILKVKIYVYPTNMPECSFGPAIRDLEQWDGFTQDDLERIAHKNACYMTLYVFEEGLKICLY